MNLIINQILLMDLNMNVKLVLLNKPDNGEKLIEIIIMKIPEITMQLIYKLELVKICIKNYGVF